MHGLSSFQRDLLYVLNGIGQSSGMAVKEELEDYYEEQITRQRVYRNLNTLADEELVDKTGDHHGRFGEKQYELTDQGEQALKDRQEWEDDLLDRSGLDIV